jgi:hypothetical protein
VQNLMTDIAEDCARLRRQISSRRDGSSRARGSASSAELPQSERGSPPWSPAGRAGSGRESPPVTPTAAASTPAARRSIALIEREVEARLAQSNEAY